MREKSLSLCQYYCQEVLTMHGGGGLLEREDRAKGQTLAFWVLLLTGSMLLVCFSLLVRSRLLTSLLALFPGCIVH
jgi:hypothetical protein